MAEAKFWGLTMAFALASLVTVATTVHVIPYLTAHGVSATTAGSVLGLIGLMQLPGRAVFSPIRRRLSWQWTATVVFMMQAAALVVLTRTSGPSGFAAFACLFGMGNGMSTLLRASTLADLYEQSIYGRVSGVVALFTTVGRAGGPVFASLALVASGSYERTFSGLALIIAAAAAFVLIPWRLTSPCRPLTP
jgi:MFS family permease